MYKVKSFKWNKTNCCTILYSQSRDRKRFTYIRLPFLLCWPIFAFVWLIFSAKDGPSAVLDNGEFIRSKPNAFQFQLGQTIYIVSIFKKETWHGLWFRHV